MKKLVLLGIGLIVGYKGYNLAAQNEKVDSSAIKRYKGIENIVTMEFPDSAYITPSYYDLYIDHVLDVNFSKEDKEYIYKKRPKNLMKLLNLLPKNIRFIDKSQTSIKELLDNNNNNSELIGIKVIEESDDTTLATYRYLLDNKEEKQMNLCLFKKYIDIPFYDLIKEMKKMRKIKK